MGAGTMTLDRACRLLEIASSATPEQLSAAFRRAAKAAHPDSENGDVVRFRTVIDAYHFMQQQPRLARQGKALVATPCPLPVRTVSEAPPLLVLTPLQALHGGTVRLVVAGKRYLVHVPPGIRSGDHVRLESLGKVPVMIRPADGMSVLGGDLFITHPVEPFYPRRRAYRDRNPCRSASRMAGARHDRACAPVLQGAWPARAGKPCCRTPVRQAGRL